MDLVQGLYDFLAKGGALGILTLLIFVGAVGGYKQWWVFGWAYKKRLRMQTFGEPDQSTNPTSRTQPFNSPRS
jgi:hypothetical protein